MTRLEARLTARREHAPLLVPYVTGGLGPAWCDVVRAVAAAGADAVEIGIPFSDPVMDGPTIQEASERALDGGATPASIVADAARIDVDVPLVVMTYYNPVMHAGHERFAGMLADAGIAGAIVPDLPFDELDGWGEATTAAGVASVLLAAPTTPPERLGRIAGRTEGFLYAVALLGVTGERRELAPEARAMGERCRAATRKPVLLGVGISSPAQAVEAAASADGVVVGSALVRRLLEGGGPESAGDLVAGLRGALDRVGPPRPRP